MHFHKNECNVTSSCCLTSEMKKQESLRELIIPQDLLLNFSWFQLARKENKSREEEHKLSSLCNCWLVKLPGQTPVPPPALRGLPVSALCACSAGGGLTIITTFFSP